MLELYLKSSNILPYNPATSLLRYNVLKSLHLLVAARINVDTKENIQSQYYFFQLFLFFFFERICYFFRLHSRRHRKTSCDIPFGSCSFDFNEHQTQFVASQLHPSMCRLSAFKRSNGLDVRGIDPLDSEMLPLRTVHNLSLSRLISVARRLLVRSDVIVCWH